jgi:hypothetical protein
MLVAPHNNLGVDARPRLMMPVMLTILVTRAGPPGPFLTIFDCPSNPVRPDPTPCPKRVRLGANRPMKLEHPCSTKSVNFSAHC